MERAFYPIRYAPGNGITARAWQIGGAQREAARRHLRRLYREEGVQVAFCYHEGDERVHRQALQRLREFMNE